MTASEPVASAVLSNDEGISARRETSPNSLGTKRRMCVDGASNQVRRYVMIGMHHLIEKRNESSEFLAPLNPARFGEVRLATSLRKVSESTSDETALERRARSMASHPSAATWAKVSDEVA